MLATSANRQSDRSLLANAKFRLQQLLPIQSLSRELMSKIRRDANAISAIMRFRANFTKEHFTTEIYQKLKETAVVLTRVRLQVGFITINSRNAASFKNNINRSTFCPDSREGNILLCIAFLVDRANKKNLICFHKINSMCTYIYIYTKASFVF